MNSKSARKKVIITNAKNKKMIRLAVYRSNKAIYAMLIDDINNKVLSSTNSILLEESDAPQKLAKLVGAKIAQKAKTLKISEVAFDRNGYKYHGQVKALADGAREAGLKF